MWSEDVIGGSTALDFINPVSRGTRKQRLRSPSDPGAEAITNILLDSTEAIALQHGIAKLTDRASALTYFAQINGKKFVVAKGQAAAGF